MRFAAAETKWASSSGAIRGGVAALAGVAALGAACLSFPASHALAQPGVSDGPDKAVEASPDFRQVRPRLLNRDTLIIAAGGPGTAYLAMVQDLAAAVGAGGGVRILPLVGDGGAGNLQDVLFLRGIHMAVVPANVLARAEEVKAFGGDLPRRVSYLTALYGEEVHVVARRDVAAAADLRGRKVAVPAANAAARFTVRDVFRRLGIAVETVPMPPAQALADVRSGAIAAAALVGGKPLAQVAALPKDGRMRLVSLPSAPLSGAGYSPALLLAEDYPALIPPGAMVETVAVRAVLVARSGGGGTARRVAAHTPALLGAIARLAAARPPSPWRDVNLGALLPGWSRVEAAEKWLKQASTQRREALGERADGTPPRAGKDRTTAPARRDRAALRAWKVKARGTAAASRRAKLFDEYEEWAVRQSVASESVTRRPAGK